MTVHRPSCSRRGSRPPPRLATAGDMGNGCVESVYRYVCGHGSPQTCSWAETAARLLRDGSNSRRKTEPCPGVEIL
jgi:hypothetical protein